MKIEFIDPAGQELFEAYQFYKDQLPGLQKRFLDDFKNTINLIKTFPTAWTKVGAKTRRGLFKKFPHFVLYRYENNCIYITCIAHSHRNPEYYIDRMI
ncbi:MAG: type II toxin-antitoxin system RelE/ParE family toxin [bacterium]|nr:type II toxin-antitoxin system RelE/ParE family toxin [bacterium]